MKKLLIIILAIYANFAFGQVQNDVKHLKTERSEEIYEDVENIAQFPGGINAFRTEFMRNFRGRKVIGTGEISSDITFIIEKDGVLGEVRIIGNNASFNTEADRAIKKIKQKWTPGNINGVNVRYRYRMPIRIAL